MAAHVHAELMAQYAQDATTTNKPWEFWQCKDSGEFWNDLTRSPSWSVAAIYRRKPAETWLLDKGERVISAQEKSQIANATHEIHLLFAASCAKSLEGFGMTLAKTSDHDERKQKAEAISNCFASAASYMAQQYCQALYGSSVIADVPAPQGFAAAETQALFELVKQVTREALLAESSKRPGTTSLEPCTPQDS